MDETYTQYDHFKEFYSRDYECTKKMVKNKISNIKWL